MHIFNSRHVTYFILPAFLDPFILAVFSIQYIGIFNTIYYERLNTRGRSIQVCNVVLSSKTSLKNNVSVECVIMVSCTAVGHNCCSILSVDIHLCRPREYSQYSVI